MAESNGVPKTPSHTTMATNNLNLGHERPVEYRPGTVTESGSSPEGVVSEDSGDIEVPSTPTNKKATDDRPDDAKPHIQIEGEQVDEKEGVSDSDLDMFDWDDLEARYTAEMGAINAEEDQLLDEFDQLSQGFSLWAQASQERDNERSAKRLKTRRRFVELSEMSLEQKKKHHVEVVAAFTNALKLLSGP